MVIQGCLFRSQAWGQDAVTLSPEAAVNSCDEAVLDGKPSCRCLAPTSSRRPLRHTVKEPATLASNPPALVDRLDVLFTFGAMSVATKSVIENILGEFSDPELRAKIAIYMVLISPDYAVRI